MTTPSAGPGAPDRDGAPSFQKPSSGPVPYGAPGAGPGAASPQPYGSPPPQYGGAPQPYGNPQQQQYGNPQQQYGNPQQPTTPGAVPPGWYPGPSGGPQWWDGRGWGPTAPPANDNSSTMALFCYLGMFIAGFLVPLIILLTEGKKSRFVKHHATEALNWSITTFFATFALLALYIVAFVLALGAGAGAGSADAGAGLFAGFGVFVVVVVIVFILAIAISIASLVFTIIGAVKAGQNKYWRYPVCIRLVKGGATKEEVAALNTGVVR